MYIENPKTKGSGIICAIPQTGVCPNGCKDCFFQSGRSYLEPLKENLPNLPSPETAQGRIIRMNDGNDSNVDKGLVIGASRAYNDVFFNTAIPDGISDFPGPVVLTVNPGKMTDETAYFLDEIPDNLMFVRVRVNTWNLWLTYRVVNWYTTDTNRLGNRKIPVVFTFMAYHEESDIPDNHRYSYEHRKRTLNDYYAITHFAWKAVMDEFDDMPLIYSCGREGIEGMNKCSACGNCIREYYNAKERIRK